MKKLLALVLALVMTLGLATVGTSAAYTDANDIDYTEAVDVMTAVGVFQGKGDAFAPKDGLNRAEAAKLIAYLMLGNKTAESIKGIGNKFTDVPASHWASGYIEYLATAGVVSGVGNKQFDPNGQVTAVQFAKMLLVALGYDAELEGFVGESWSINIAKQANDNDLFDGLDILGSAALTREQAAQMCLNDLKADTVDYESKGTTISLSDGVKATVDAKKSEAKTTTATKGNAIDNDDARGTTADPYTLQLGEDLYNGDLKLEDTRDDFGRPANKWTYKNVEIDTYVDRSDLKAEYTDEIKRGPMYDLLGSSVYDHLVLASNANEYATLSYYEDGAGGVVNGSSTASTNKTEVEKFVQKNGDKAINSGNSSGRGTLTQVFVDSDDNVTIAVINTYLFQASSDYRASSEDLVIAQPSDATKIALDSTRLELGDFPEIKDLKKDDYILVTVNHDNANAVYSVDSIAKAELLTATVDKYVGDDSVTLDGETKKYSKKVDANTKATDYTVGQETTVVLDKYGYIIYVDETVVANNYVFISELYQANGSASSNVKANAYFTDGTDAEITIKEISGVSVTKNALATTAAAGSGATKAYGTMNTDAAGKGDKYAGWYTYTKNTAGEYTLTKVGSGNKVYASYADGVAAGLTVTKSDTVKFVTNATPFAVNEFYNVSAQSGSAYPKANDKTIMVVTYADSNDVDVYTGVKNLPEINLTGATGHADIFSVVNSSDYAKYVFVTLEGAYTVFGSESESLLYVIKFDKKNVISTDTTYYTYKALDENAKEISIEADGSNIFSTGYTAYYKTSTNADGRYTRGQKVPTGNDGSAKYMSYTGKSNTISANNGTLSIAGDNFTLAKDYKLVVVSQADALNKLVNTSYEANIVTAEGLEAMVQGYTVTYDVQAKMDDNYSGNGGKILEAYVTITKAVQGTTAASASAANGIVAVKLDDAMRGISGTAVSFNANNAIKYYYSGSVKPTNREIGEAITAEFAKYDNLKAYTISVGTNGAYNVYKDGADTGVDLGTVADEAATLTSSSNWTISTDTGSSSAVVVVPEGVTLTVDSGKTLTCKDIIVSGGVIVKGTVNISGNYHILKSGHVTVDGGAWNGSGTGGVTANTIEGKSLVATDNDNNIVSLGTVTSVGNVTVEGGSVNGTLTSKGDVTISGTAYVAAVVKVESGTATVAKTVKTDTSAAIVNLGGTVKVADVAVATGTGVGKSAEVTGAGATVNSAAETSIAAAQAAAATIDATFTLSNNSDLKITELSGATAGANANTYSINKDTVTIKFQYTGKGTDATGTIAVTYAAGTVAFTGLKDSVSAGSKSGSVYVSGKDTTTITIKLTPASTNG